MLHRPHVTGTGTSGAIGRAPGELRGHPPNGSRDPSRDGDRSSSGCSTSSSCGGLATADDPGRVDRRSTAQARCTALRTPEGAVSDALSPAVSARVIGCGEAPPAG